jgi:hypothetical protein
LKVRKGREAVIVTDLPVYESFGESEVVTLILADDAVRLGADKYFGSR